MVWRFWTGGPQDDSKDRQWARRQAAEAQNHIFDRCVFVSHVLHHHSNSRTCVVAQSLGEQYGLRIIPGSNSFLVLPNNVSRANAARAILHPGGPTHGVPSVAGLAAPAWLSADDDGDVLGGSGLGLSFALGGGGGGGGGLGGGFVLVISADEHLLRRMNELEGAETCSCSSTGGKGTDAKWQIEQGKVRETLWQFANVA